MSDAKKRDVVRTVISSSVYRLGLFVAVAIE